MITKSIIVAIDKNNAIGRENNLLCHLPNDLKYFKQTTKGHPLIMGRKTYESLPNGALPNRRNIVLTRQQIFFPDCEICKSVNEALQLCKDEGEVFFIGGALVYTEVLPVADKLYITEINHAFEGADAFFPSIDPALWAEVSRTANQPDKKNLFPHTFVRYERR